MSLPLAYRPEVQEEIDAAYAWYEHERAGLGEEFLAALRELLDQIQQGPEMYGVVYRNVRAVLVRRFPYVVYYRIEPNRIVIVAMQHGRRSSRRWRSRA